MAKGCALSTGYLPRGGLPRNSVDRITDRPDTTSAVDRGRKASIQTNKQLYELRHEKTFFWHMQEKKAQISCAVTKQLIRACVFTTYM